MYQLLKPGSVRVCLWMCADVYGCAGACTRSVGDERVGVNINNDELKCQRRSERCKMGEVYVGVGVPCLYLG